MEKEFVAFLQRQRWHSADEIFIWLTDHVSLMTALILTGFVFQIIRKRNFSRNHFYFLVFALGSAALLTHLFKWIIHRSRPYEVSENIRSLTSGGGYSFPSGHAAEVFTLAFALLIICRKRSLKILIWIWAFFIAYTRMAFGAHYPTDILGGMAVAALSVFISKRIFLNNKPLKNKIDK